MQGNGHEGKASEEEYVSRKEFVEFQRRVRRTLTALLDLYLFSEPEDRALGQRLGDLKERVEGMSEYLQRLQSIMGEMQHLWGESPRSEGPQQEPPADEA